MNIFKRIRYLFDSSDDPIKHCELYKDCGCSHIDGIICDYPECIMNKKHILQKNCLHKNTETKTDFYRRKIISGGGCDCISQGQETITTCKDCGKQL